MKNKAANHSISDRILSLDSLSELLFAFVILITLTFGGSISLRAEVIFEENFETPAVTGFDDNTVPNTGIWIGSTEGFGATNRGLFNERVIWPAYPPFDTPYGKQAYKLNYSNSGLTTAQGAFGEVVTEGVTYKVSFNIATEEGAGSATYLVELVAFDLTDDNNARKDCRGARPGTVLASVSGTVTTTDMSETGELLFTPQAGDPSLGKEIGVRLVNASLSPQIYDNLRFLKGHDMSPSPASGITTLGGNLPLSWSNHTANTGTDVWVDVWFGTDPANLAKVVDKGLNLTTTTVNVPSAGTYYWRVDSYLDGSSAGSPLSGDQFYFVVDDTDGDGFTDEYELANTNPPSNTGLNPGDDLDGDNLTNLEEFNLSTDPNLADTDGDTLDDGEETTGAGSRPATSPLTVDTDGDGLSDLVESNTGTWVSSADTGTNPADSDWDDDGIKDGVETNTGVLVDRFNTGTDPYVKDTDGDGAWDWYEVEAALTDPHNAADVPSVPYPLPDPDGSTGVTNKPVKVYIMSGQSNMVGIGDVNDLGEPGALSTATMLENKWPNFLDAQNNWTERNDVWYEGVVTATAKKWLSIGCGSSATRVGPELGFGHIVGWYHDEPVIIIKSSQGNRSIAWDFLPPGSPRYTVGSTTYAGYGDSQQSWPSTDPAPPAPAPGAWYAGKQYDDCVAEVHNVLNNFATKFPQYAAQGYEIEGFVWWQGHKDGENAVYADRYETNLVNLISALRTEFSAPDAPVVVGTIGFNGGPYAPGENYFKIHNAQTAVGDPIQYPEFAGKVTSVDTLPFWRELNESPGNQGFHYNNSGETYTLVGDALGRAMIQVIQSNDALVATSPSDDAINAESGSDLIITFNEDQVAGSGNLTLKNITDGIDTVIPVTDSRVSIIGNQVTIETSDLIDWETDFVVRIDAGFVETVGGVPFAGILDDTTWNFTTGPDALTIAVKDLSDHINGTISLNAQQIADYKTYFDLNFDKFDRDAQTIDDLLSLVETFDAVNGPLWVTTGSFNRDTQPDDLNWTIYHVMQYIMDEVYNSENLALYESTLDGFKFESIARFPGSVNPPADPNNVHTIAVNASYPNTAGWERQNDDFPARRATGAYLAPGTIATVTVPQALVGQGLQIRVGAHAWDMEERGRSTVWRLDRATLLYDITSTTTKVASPYGGGIYIEVPLGVDLGVHNIDITGCVRSPLFSMTSYHTTTVAEWQATERNNPAPWTDFRTDNFMVQIPTAWIYNVDDPTSALQDWSKAVDTYNDLMGFPRVRGKESLYLQVDVINRSSVFAPGYPQVNFSSNNPTADNYNGHRNTYLVNGPRTIPNWEFHEAGHAYRFPKFGGETESTVNLPHAAIMNQCFGVDIDTAHADSLGFAGNPSRTMNNTAIVWMTSFNFSPREVEMASGEKSYQLKGHAKYVDVARLFGWDKVNAFFKTYVDQYEATGVKPSPSNDTMTIDFSKAVGKDMRPLLHFWGIFPDDPVAVEAAINAEGLVQSAEVYELLTYYKSIVPADNTAFQAFGLAWWGGVPDALGTWTESEHGRQWDTTDWATPYGKVVQRPNGEIYDETASAAAQARVQEIIDLYFPLGNPDPGYTSPPSPDPMSFATAPFGVDPQTISMTAHPASDVQGPVEYYIENVTTGQFRDWSTDQNWTQTGLSLGVNYDYRVKARDALGNETAFSPTVIGTTLADNEAPSLVSLSPVDDSNNIDVYVDFTLSFDEDVAAGAGSIIISNLTDGTDTVIDVTDGTQVSFVGSAVVVDPANDLDAGKSYAIKLSSGAITDVWGNVFTGISDNVTWNVNTALTPQETILLAEDFESPDVNASAGAGNTTGVIPDNGNWVGATQGFGATRRGITDKSGGDFTAPDPNFQGFAFRYTNSGLTSAEGAIGALTVDLNYEVSVDVVRDDGQNAGTPYTIQLVAMDPGDNRADCSGSRPGTVLASTTGNAPADGSFASATLQFTASAGDPSIGKDLAVRFLGATTSAIIDNVEVKTVNTGGSDGVPPAIASLTPVGGSTDVAVDANLMVAFNEDIAAGSGVITLKNLTAGTQSTIGMTDGSQVSISGGVLTINPVTDLAYESNFAIQIDAGAIQDLAGNSFAGISDDITWNFITGLAPDLTAPTLAAADIVDNQAGGPVFENTLVTYTVTFSEDMDESSVDASDFSNAGSSPVTVGSVIETSPGVFSVQVTPTSPGSLNLRVSAGAVLTDVAGNALDTTNAIADDTTLTVDPINTAPTWASDPIAEVNATEDAAYAATLADDVSDAQSDPLTFAKVSGPAWLSVAPDGSLSGIPVNADVGTNNFTVSVSDGIASPVEVALNINVINVNDEPVFTVDPIRVTDASEDIAYVGSIAGTANDDDGDNLSYAKISGPDWLVVAADGTLSGTPANDDVGINAFTVSVTDSIATPVQATLNITVLNVNDAPTWVSNPVVEADATESEAFVATLSDDANDDDGDTLTFTKVSGPAWLNVASDGGLSGTPAPTDIGINSFTVSVSDGIDPAVEVTLEITVVAAPVGVVFSDDFEVASGSPDVDSAGSDGNTSGQINTANWVRANQGFGGNSHGLVDESHGDFTDPSGEQAYAFRYTNSGITTAQGLIGNLTAGATYTVTFDVVVDGHNTGDSYSAALVTFNGAARNDVRGEDGGTGATALLDSVSGSYTGSSYQEVSFTYVSDGSESTLGQDVVLRIFGATTSATIDNVRVQVIPPVDSTPPSISSADIVDDQAGGPVTVGDLVTYTVTFDEDMDETTVDAADFSNAGSSSIAVGAVTETTPGVFTVEVTPTNTGTLQLQIAAGAVLNDVAGNALETTVAIADDTTITVDPVMVTVPDVTGQAQATAESNITAVNLTVGTITTEYSGSVPAGNVISQGLASGSSVPVGSTVDLVVSLGIDPSPKLVRTTVSSVSSASWTTVDLGQTYNSAVIVATPIYPNTTTPPVVTRITNVTSTGFDLKVDRADGLTGAVSIDVSIVAVDEGVYTQAVDGVTMEAVKYTSTVTAENNNWAAEARSFQNAYANPVVVGQVMSANDANWSVFWSMGSSRTNPVNASNLNVGKHVGEDPNAVRADETIGYIVIESGSGTINGVAYEAALGGDSVRGFDNSSSPYNYSLTSGLGSVSAAAASISGMDGNNGAWAVLSGNPALTTTSIGLHACEDQLNDNEQSHTATQVGYIVFE